MKKKRILIVILIILIIFVGIIIYGSNYFYNIAIARNKKTFLASNPDLKKKESDKKDTQPTPIPKKSVPWVEEQNYQTIEITSDDNLKLKAYYLKATEPSNKLVILAHGYTSKGKDMGFLGKFYNEDLGYNILMPDDRGHGDSEGDYIGFGWPDRKDYVKWIELMIEKLGENCEIVLHGISMGGATVMMVSGEKLPEQVKAIVEDCGYTSVFDQLSYQFSRMYHLPEFPLLHTTSLLTKVKAGYNFWEASSIKQVEKSKTPILFIHGTEDTFVPYEMVNELYESCNSEKDLFIVEGAGHGACYSTDKEGYENKVREFLRKFIEY
ncbi:alpha/beta hydrolase [Vallitalea longa]|uniref:Alpha/beta hydrolase n=1 Tax=Vallitalea longa TaxID=2936439 RepID=A0A9W5YFL9_9FIRM|nr:alpha/beta hydrolase [Vallitalea longa]GKX31625.1 alpha/beta hydrolase [Vallitalea longa]